MRAVSLAVRVALWSIAAFVASGACSSETRHGRIAAKCQLNSECDGQLVCTAGRCHQACVETRDCPAGQRCATTSDGSVCLLPDDARCTFTSDCNAPLHCAVDSQCRNECRTLRDCLGGQLCTRENVCAEPSEVDDTGQLRGRDAGAGAGGRHGTGGRDSGTSGASGASGGALRDASTDVVVPPDARAEAGPKIPEDCTNGEDDDGDGDVDCKDSDCGESTCSLPVPVGFTGPVVYWRGTSGDEPACAAPYDVELFTGHDTPVCADPSCPCTCSAVNGETCNSKGLFLYSGGSCPGGTGVTATFVNFTAGCNDPADFNYGGWLLGGPSVPNAGSCTPSGGAPSIPASGWSITGRLCGGSTLLPGGCVAGTLCTPKPRARAGDRPGLCVFREGDVACPSTGYSEKALLYSNLKDTRACGACTCGSPAGGTCDSTLHVYKGNACGGAEAGTFSFGDDCKAVTGGSFSFTPKVVKASKCDPSRPKNGGCTETEPTTVCCTP